MQKYFILYTREDQMVKSLVENSQVMKLLGDSEVKNVFRLTTSQLAELKDGQVVWKDVLEEEVG